MNSEGAGARLFADCHVAVIKLNHKMRRTVKYCFFVVFLLILILQVDSNLSHNENEHKEPPCDFTESVNITGGEMDNEGNIQFNGDVFSPNQYGTFNYELDVVNQTIVPVSKHIRGCICLIKPCLRFCCGFNEIMNLNDSNCEEYFEGNLNYSFPVLDDKSGKSSIVDIYEKFDIFFGIPCDQCHVLEPELNEDERFELLNNGNLQFRDGKTIDHKSSCFIHLYNEDLNDFELSVLVCYQTPVLTYPYGMLTSVPFLFMTFLVYALIPELQNLHGKNLMCYVFSLFIAFILMPCINLYTNEIVGISDDLCSALGYSVYFAFMASFFWLNVLSYDIFLTFRDIGGVKRAMRRRFIWYSCYAWGCATALLCWIIIADKTNILPMNYRPRIGKSSCGFEDDQMTEFLYLYLIIITLICANITLFALTSYKIVKLQRETAQMTKGESRKFNKLESEKDRFGLYLRLFIVMGVSWLFEITSWAVSNPSWFSYVTDFLNCLQGVFIFVLFVWKPKIKHLIVKRYRDYKGLSAATSPGPSRTTSSIYSRQSSSNSRGTYLFRTCSMDVVDITPM